MIQAGYSLTQCREYEDYSIGWVELMKPKLVIRCRPSGENVTDLTESPVTSSLWCRCPVSASKSRTVLSFEEDASLRPSGKNVIELTLAWCPLSLFCKAPATASQSQTVPSYEADAGRFPSGENVTSLTRSKWPSSVFCRTPIAASQSRTVLSLEGDASLWPPGENVKALTLRLWPSSMFCRAHLLRVPEPNSVVTYSGCEPLAVEWKGHIFYAVKMTLEGVLQNSGLCIPEQNGLVLYRWEPRAVWWKYHSLDRAFTTLARVLQSSGLRIPESDSIIVWSRCNRQAVGQNFHRFDLGIVTR